MSNLATMRIVLVKQMTDAQVADFWFQSRKMPNGCWVWQGGNGDRGYGQYTLNGMQIRCHRIAYQLAYGSLRVGSHIHHTCHNRRCVNPSHLQQLSSSDHLRLERQRDCCIRGHAFDAANTHIRANGDRYCRACGRLRIRARRGVLTAQEQEAFMGRKNRTELERQTAQAKQVAS